MFHADQTLFNEAMTENVHFSQKLIYDYIASNALRFLQHLMVIKPLHLQLIYSGGSQPRVQVLSRGLQNISKWRYRANMIGKMSELSFKSQM